MQILTVIILGFISFELFLLIAYAAAFYRHMIQSKNGIRSNGGASGRSSTDYN